MNPDENQVSNPIIPERQTVPAVRDDSTQSEAAASVVRSQIDSIYQSDTSYDQPAGSTKASPGDHLQEGGVYSRTHDEQQLQTTDSYWQNYHSAWQSYYQQYYERYYVGHVNQAKQQLAAEYSGQAEDEAMSTDEALYDLRDRLRSQIVTKAQKAKKSRHFIPIISGISVMLIFAFLQFNQIIFANVAAYVSPGSISPTGIIIDPTSNLNVGPDPILLIPKINVDVPIIWNTNAYSQDSLNAAMAVGVAWFGIPGANSKPGQVGNTVLSGHSSNDWTETGKYKFIFARLDQLDTGDTMYINYNSKRYTYVVTKKQVVGPNDVSSLVYSTDKPVLTLVTCTPLGTSLNRLLVVADQISPSPTSASAKPKVTSAPAQTTIPGNAPTLLERLFGAR